MYVKVRTTFIGVKTNNEWYVHAVWLVSNTKKPRNDMVPNWPLSSNIAERVLRKCSTVTSDKRCVRLRYDYTYNLHSFNFVNLLSLINHVSLVNILLVYVNRTVLRKCARANVFHFLWNQHSDIKYIPNGPWNKLCSNQSCSGVAAKNLHRVNDQAFLITVLVWYYLSVYTYRRPILKYA